MDEDFDDILHDMNIMVRNKTNPETNASIT